VDVTRYIKAIVFAAAVLVAATVHPCSADVLLKENWRTKTFAVSGVLRSAGNGEFTGAPCTQGNGFVPAGCTAGIVHAHALGINFDCDVMIDSTYFPSTTEERDGTTVTVNHGAVIWYASILAPDGSGHSIYYAAPGPSADSAGQSTFSAGECPFGFTVSGLADLYMESNYDAAPNAPWKWELNRENAAADLFYMSNVRVYDVIKNPTVTCTLGQGTTSSFSYSYDESHPFAGGGARQNSVSVEALAWSPLQGDLSGWLQSDGLIHVPSDPPPGVGPGAYNAAAINWVEAAVSRSFGDHSEGGSRTLTKTGKAVLGTGNRLYPDYSQAHTTESATFGDGKFSMSGGYVNAAHDGYGITYRSHTIYATGWFQEMCGSFDVDYRPDVEDMFSGAHRADMQIKGNEIHPRVEIEPWQDTDTEERSGADYHYYWDPLDGVFESWGAGRSYTFGQIVNYDGTLHKCTASHTAGTTWNASMWSANPSFNKPIDVNATPLVHYGGEWEYGFGGAPGQANCVVSRYVDLPSDATAGSSITHGRLKVTNLTDGWDGTQYHDSAIGEPTHPGWKPWPIPWTDPVTGLDVPNVWDPGYEQGSKWLDNQVTITGDSNFKAANAITVTLAPPGAVANPPLVFDQASDWTAQNLTLTLDNGAIKLDDVAADSSAEIPETVMFERNIRLTGTRFAKVNWWRELPVARFDLSFGGNKWHVRSAKYADWASGTTYYPATAQRQADRVVQDGYVWTCVGEHTSGTWAGDTSYWAQGTDECTEIDLCFPDVSTVDNPSRQIPIQRTVHLSPVIQSPHGSNNHDLPTGQAGSQEYTISAPEGATEVKLHFARKEFGSFGQVEISVIDGDNNDRSYLLAGDNYDGTDRWMDDSIKAPVHITLSWDVPNGTSLYGFMIDRVKYVYQQSLGLSTQQSIVPYELPLDASLPVEGQLGHRQTDELNNYAWEYPKGWGVGRVVSVKVEPKTPGAVYKLRNVQLYRKKPEEGGFARLYVLPHQSPWVDSRTMDDFALSYAGEQSAPNQPNNVRYSYPKAFVVVDGAVALEIPAGCCTVDNRENTGDLHETPWYRMTRYKMIKEDDDATLDLIAYPEDRYQDRDIDPTVYPTAYHTNGVVNVTVNHDNWSDFLKQNCYVGFLNEGLHQEDTETNTISCGLTVWADTIEYELGMGGTMCTAMSHHSRGIAQGIAVDADGKPMANRQLVVTTPSASAGQETNAIITTDALGWFQTPAVNTKPDDDGLAVADIEMTADGAGAIVRNRFASRIALWQKALGDSDSTFEITDANPFAIEPAYDDKVEISWRRTDGTFPAQSILVMQRDDTNGEITSIEGAKYHLIHTLPISAGLESDNPYYDGATNLYKHIGKTDWQPPRDQAAGRYALGVEYTDDTVQTMWNRDGEECWPHFFVAVSVYDVYSTNSAPLYTGDTNQGTTEIHYSLSHNLASATVNIGGKKTVAGTAVAGHNVLKDADAWDGKDASGQYVGEGLYGIQVTTVPAAGQPLQILNLPTSLSFTQGSVSPLSIPFDLKEPVQRPQATTARLFCRIYDSEGQLVRKLRDGEASIPNGAENGTPVTVNNNSSLTDGHNALTWDGKDEGGREVDAGTYTLSLSAEDNAGVGCDSQCAVRSITVNAAAAPSCKLEAYAMNDGEEALICGNVAPGNALTWTDSTGGQGFITPEEDGSFSLALNTATAGLRSVTLTATDPQTQTTAQKTLQVFVNNITVSAPLASPGSAPLGEQGRFNPSAGQSISVGVASQANDAFDAEVIDPFSAPTCVDQSSPIRASEFLNGAVSEKVVKTLWTNQRINATSLALAWDGTDDNSDPVPAGPYVIRVSRCNGDGLLTASFDVAVVVHSAGTAETLPIISDVGTLVRGASVAVWWQTDTPTTGEVAYAEGPTQIASVRSDTLSTWHAIWLPVTRSGGTYTYWVSATNASLSSLASHRCEVTAGQGELIGKISVTSVAMTGVHIDWSTLSTCLGRVQYARVGPAVTALNWEASEEAAATQQHTVHLTGLSPDAEYVFRVGCASDSSFVDATWTPYESFVTEASLPSVEIQTPLAGAVVNGVVPVVVTASDVTHRFEVNRISRVELVVDDAEDAPLSPSSHASGSDTYCFALDTSSMCAGYHSLTAYATDDFWNTQRYTIRFFVGSATTSESRGVQSISPVLVAAMCPGSVQVAVSKKALWLWINGDQNAQELATKVNWDVIKSTVESWILLPPQIAGNAPPMNERCVLTWRWASGGSFGFTRGAERSVHFSGTVFNEERFHLPTGEWQHWEENTAKRLRVGCSRNVIVKYRDVTNNEGFTTELGLVAQTKPTSKPIRQSGPGSPCLIVLNRSAIGTLSGAEEKNFLTNVILHELTHVLMDEKGEGPNEPWCVWSCRADATRWKTGILNNRLSGYQTWSPWAHREEIDRMRESMGWGRLP